MKKLIALMLTLTMIFALASCGSKDNDAASGDTDGEKTVITMACSADFPPYEYYEGDEIVGIDVEIANAICDKLGYELEITDTNFDSIIPALVSEKFDIGMSGFTVTEDRLLEVDFSNTYTTSKQIVVVPEDSPIASVDDILSKDNTYTIAVQTGTTGDIYITGDVEDIGLSHEIAQFTKYSDAVVALTTGKADCLIVDEAVGLAFIEETEGLKALDTEYALEDYAIAFPKNSPYLDEFNEVLDQLIEDGTVQQIIDKYIK